MKVHVFSIDGSKAKEIELPKVFNTPAKPLLIRRAVLAEQSAKRQPYGADPLAGMRSSAHYHGSRHYRYTMMNREMSRIPRIHGRVGYLASRARVAPHAVKGRAAHPPKVARVLAEKINRKEQMQAIKSALACTADKEAVMKRHKVKLESVPIIIADDFQDIKKTKEIATLLGKLGLKPELERAAKKKIRAGRGKARNRPYRRKKGLLIIVHSVHSGLKSARNIAGIDVADADKLTVSMLAPGGTPGRLTVYTESAVKKLGELYG